MPKNRVAVALRPFLPADAGLVAEIFRSSVEGLTGDDYDAAQQDAWVSAADDATGLAERLGRQLTLVAIIGGAPVGFASLAENERVDMLYVHPSVAGRGVGTALCEALEKLAAARGASRLTVDASDTAHGFFARRGFVDQRRNTVMLGGEWLSNTTMTKALMPAG
jgi:putative acetyltransferase